MSEKYIWDIIYVYYTCTADILLHIYILYYTTCCFNKYVK